MIFPLMPQTAMHGDAEFNCKKMGCTVAYSKCLDWYVDHNALGRKNSPCFKCKEGQDKRETFARS